MGVETRTHQRIDRRLSGEPLEVGPGRSRVRLTTTPEMAADAEGLVHGGFIFSLADHCAMLAVNELFVVLGSAEMRFLAPLRVGDVVEAHGEIIESEDGRHRVEVVVERTSETSVTLLARGVFRCIVMPRHVLESDS